MMGLRRLDAGLPAAPSFPSSQSTHPVMTYRPPLHSLGSGLDINMDTLLELNPDTDLSNPVRHKPLIVPIPLLFFCIMLGTRPH